MQRIVDICFFYLFLCLLSSLAACGTAGRANGNFALSGGGELVGTWLPGNGYKGDPQIDYSSFSPPGNSMAVIPDDGARTELDWTVDLRWRLNPFLYTGITSTLLNAYLSNQYLSKYCGIFFCNTIKYANLDWWDEVMADEYAVTYSPSIGWAVGTMFAEDGDDLGNYRFFVEWSTSIRYYHMVHNIYAGKDCIGCRNTSYVKETIDLDKGIAWRQTLKVGSGRLSGVFWVELEGRYVCLGMGIRIAGSLFGDAKPDQ